VFEGIYNEELRIGKEISLIGNHSSNTTINVNYEDEVMISAERVILSRFTIAGDGDYSNFAGIQLLSNNCTISYNTFENVSRGIFILGDHATVTGNSFIVTMWGGIYLSSCHSCRVWDNDFTGSGIEMYDDSVESWTTHDIGTNNTVNGRPLVYLAGANSLTVPAGAGQIILVDCHDIIVEYQNCSDSVIGIQVAFSRFITVRNNTSNGNSGGIYIIYTSDFLVMDNTCERNIIGIVIARSNTGKVNSNRCRMNSDHGIMMSGNRLSNPNLNHALIDNIISNNDRHGIYMDQSDGHLISNNEITGNSVSGLDIYDSRNNSILNNTIWLNGKGIFIYDNSLNTTIRDNLIGGDQEFGLEVIFVTEKVVANFNWWGDDSGPYHPGENPFGKGNAVSDAVIFAPWIGMDESGDLYVDDDAEPGGDGSELAPFRYIQDAVDAAHEGNIIHVAAGTYRENVIIDIPVDIQGNG